MAGDVISVKCPECGASVELDQQKRSAVCDYCGTKVILKDDNSFTFNIHDEAEVIKAETDQAVKLKQIEWKEMSRIKEIRFSKKSLKLAGILAAVGFVLLTLIGPLLSFLPEDSAGDNAIEMLGGIMVLIAMIIGSLYFMQWFKQRQESEESFDGAVTDGKKLPSELRDYNFRTYQAVEELLREAGFTNVVSIPLRDVTKEGRIIKPDFISKITINGNELRRIDRRYPTDSRIVISYHSYK